MAAKARLRERSSPPQVQKKRFLSSALYRSGAPLRIRSFFASSYQPTAAPAARSRPNAHARSQQCRHRVADRLPDQCRPPLLARCLRNNHGLGPHPLPSGWQLGSWRQRRACARLMRRPRSTARRWRCRRAWLPHDRRLQAMGPSSNSNHDCAAGSSVCACRSPCVLRSISLVRRAALPLRQCRKSIDLSSCN
jgi:hypothetical protein